MSDKKTAETMKRPRDADRPIADGGDLLPGLALIFANGQPILRTLPMVDGVLTVGREHPALEPFADPLMSRRHAKVTYDGAAFVVTDQDSANGTSVDDMPAPAHTPQVMRRFVRMGDSVFIPVSDLRPLKKWGVKISGSQVLGPAMQQLLDGVAQAAQHGSLLHITGESGVGKEGVARAFHDAGPGDKGRFIAVNCATISDSIAERLLFGARRGAFSGADTDADGYLQAADGGTLFLDEVAELSLAVQAKLLRVLENKDVLPVGATRARSVTLRLCSATHKSLRAQVSEGRLREDLFFRIASPQLSIPPLRQRLEEVPWLLSGAVQSVAAHLKVDISLIETCLLRSWPGNIRELLAEVRSAAQVALAAGAARLEASHLSQLAGVSMAETAPAAAPPGARQPAPEPKPQPIPEPDRATLEDALRRSNGNVAAAARMLKVHRTQFYRWLVRCGLSLPRGGKAS